jgi:hypothetical protein
MIKVGQVRLTESYFGQTNCGQPESRVKGLHKSRLARKFRRGRLVNQLRDGAKGASAHKSIASDFGGQIS